MEVRVEMIVLKRDGRAVSFDHEKISSALQRANQELPLDKKVSEAGLDQVMDMVLAEIERRFEKDIQIYEIQNIVEQQLLQAHQYDLAEQYIQYRTQRDFQRHQATDINREIHKLLSKDRAVVNENANKDSEVFNTQRDLTAGIVGKSIGLKMLPEHVANAHQKGDIHYHDLDYSPYTPMTNCCLIDFKGMLANGFKIGNAEVESPKSIQTATAQISQIIANVASSQYGGCSADRIDEFLAPYAELNYQKHLKDAEIWVLPEKQEAYARLKTQKDIYDAMQSLEYEINTLFTSNGQTPFTSLGFGLGQGWFEREIQKAILNIRINGLGSEHRTAIFPKLIFTLKRGLNLEPGSPNYDIKELALECATKRMYPDVIFYENIVKITGSFKAPMGCRSFLQGWIDPKTGKDVEDGRMNLGVVTVNIPRIALESHGDKDRFWKIFDERMAVAHQALQFRIMRCKQATPVNAPTLFRFGAFGRLGANDSVDQLFRNERATVSLGYIGLYEATSVFYGKDWMRDHDWDPEGKEFALSIVKRMNELCKDWSTAEGYHYSVYSTPAESLTDRFNRMDREKFGEVDGVTDHDFYTNSFHYPVWLQPTPMEKLDYEKDFPYYASGGFINYCEFPCLQANPKALEAVWDYAYTIGIGYLGTNTPIDRCYECGFEGDFEPTEEGFKCPECGNSDPDRCNVTKRTCGYLGNPVQRPMVHGRHEEIAHRVKHMSGETGHVTLDDGSEREWFEEAK